MDLNPKYRSRAAAAWWNKTFLAMASVISVLLLLLGFDWWSALIVAAILTVTYFEFRVHHYFLTGDARAPGLGFLNQSCFAVAILLYGFYHAVYPPQIQALVPQEMRDLVDPSMVDFMQTTVVIGYLVIGILGGLSQFGLAWYYRSAKG